MNERRIVVTGYGNLELPNHLEKNHWRWLVINVDYWIELFAHRPIWHDGRWMASPRSLHEQPGTDTSTQEWRCLGKAEVAGEGFDSSLTLTRLRIEDDLYRELAEAKAQLCRDIASLVEPELAERLKVLAVKYELEEGIQ